MFGKILLYIDLLYKIAIYILTGSQAITHYISDLPASKAGFMLITPKTA